MSISKTLITSLGMTKRPKLDRNITASAKLSQLAKREIFFEAASQDLFLAQSLYKAKCVCLTHSQSFTQASHLAPYLQAVILKFNGKRMSLTSNATVDQSPINDKFPHEPGRFGQRPRKSSSFSKGCVESESVETSGPKFDGLKATNACHLMQRIFSSQGYGSTVHSWDGSKSAINQEADSDKKKSRKRTFNDRYSAQLDAGKKRKVKPTGQGTQNKDVTNPFQQLQNAKCTSCQ